MYAIKVDLKKAEEAKKYLISENNLSKNYKILKKGQFVYFPIDSKSKISKKYSVVKADLPKRNKEEKNLRNKIVDKLTKKEQQKLKTAFDQVGTIAILEIDEGLRKKEKIIAEALLNINSQIKTVLRKADWHSGVFRTQKMKYLAGEKTKETEYKEHGVKLCLDVEKVYFSPRLSTERKRIYKQIKRGEEILVMFSGCAPYPCVFSKNSHASIIYGVEINPVGHEYGLKNVKLNKLDNINLFLGDVRKVVPKFKKKFDRILMPLPKSAEDFLDIALGVVKDNGIIHFYDFLHEDEFDKAKEKIRKACKKDGKKCKILRLVKCGQHSPRTYRLCVDFKVY